MKGKKKGKKKKPTKIHFRILNREALPSGISAAHRCNSPPLLNSYPERKSKKLRCKTYFPHNKAYFKGSFL